MDRHLVCRTHMAQTTGNGIIAISSNHSVHQTVEKLKAILQAKKVTLFALVDHSGEAESVGMKMRPTKLLTIPREGGDCHEVRLRLLAQRRAPRRTQQQARAHQAGSRCLSQAA